MAFVFKKHFLLVISFYELAIKVSPRIAYYKWVAIPLASEFPCFKGSLIFGVFFDVRATAFTDYTGSRPSFQMRHCA